VTLYWVPGSANRWRLTAEYTPLPWILRSPWCGLRGDVDSAWSLPLLKDSTPLSNRACDTSHGPQERPRYCQGDGETLSSPCTGASLTTAQKSNEATAKPESSPPRTWEEARDGAGQVESLHQAQAEHKRRVPQVGGGRLGTMETPRASLSLGRWSLWLLLLGLALPSASAQALSYREAVLRAVDQLNEQSSEPNIYRLLELDQPPQDVSQGGGWGRDPLGGGAETQSREGSLSPSPVSPL